MATRSLPIRADAAKSCETGRRGPGNWTPDEWHRISAAIDNMKPANERQIWRAYLLIARDTGLARDSILRLRRDEIAPNGVLVVSADLHPWQTVARLRNDTLGAIEAAKSDGEHLVAFPFATTRTCQLRWRDILKRGGLQGRPLSMMDSQSRHTPSEALAVAVPADQTGRPATLLEYYERYYFKLRLCGRSDRTDDLYRYTIRNFQRFLERTPTLDDLTDLTVCGMLEWMRTRHLTPETIAKEQAQLLAMWRFACRQRFVENYPTLPPEKIPRREPLAWMVDELSRLFRCAESMPGNFGTVPKAHFWSGLLWVLYETAERISAVIQLEWTHFDLDRGYVTIPAEFRKGGRADKRSKIRLECVAAVKRLKGREKKVFYWAHSESSLWSHYGQLLKAAGLPTDHKSKFHRIRKTVASLYESSGHNATELLGHSRRSVTLKYLDTRIVQPKHVADVLPSPLAEGTVKPC